MALFGVLGVLCLALVVWVLLDQAIKVGIGPFADEWLFVPDYPGAQQVQINTATKSPEIDFYAPNKPYKVVTYTTTDPPKRIFDFYRDDLKQRAEDWRIDDAEETSNSLRVFGFGHNDNNPNGGGTMFIVQVKTEQSGSITHVTVERSYEPGG